MGYRANSLSWITRFFRHGLHDLAHDYFSRFYYSHFNEQICLSVYNAFNFVVG